MFWYDMMSELDLLSMKIRDGFVKHENKRDW